MVDGKDPFERDSGDFLKAAMVGTPAAVGAGIGVRNIMRQGVSKPQPTSVSRAMATLDRLRGSQPWELAIDEHLAFIRGEQRYIRGPGAQVAQEAWVRAVESADPMAQQYMKDMVGDIKSMKPQNVYSAIEDTMLRRRGEMAESIYRRFTRNLLALQESAAVTGFIPYEKAAGKFGGPGFEPLPKQVAEAVARIETALGIERDATRVSWYTRAGWAEEGLGTYKLTFPTAKGDINLMLPMVQEGVMATGTTQQTKYIAPDVWVWDVEKKAMTKMKRHEFLLSQFESQVVPQIKAGQMERGQIDKMVTSLQQKVIYELESITNVPAHLRTDAQMAYEEARKKAVDIMIREDEAIRLATEDELAEIARREGLFGGTSPTAMAKGRLQQDNLARLYMTPEAAQTAKRLEQGIRTYELTANARAAMEAEGMERYARYRKYESAAMKEFEPTLRRPNVRVLYVEPEVLQRMRVGEGEALARRGLQDIFEFQANQTQKLIDLRADIKAALAEGKQVTPAVGEVIGWTEANEPFRMREGWKLMQAMEHRNRALGDFYTLQYMDVQRLRSNDKFFEDLKMLMRLQDDTKFNGAVSRAARSAAMAENVDVVASLDFLKKDPRKLQQQIVSGLGEVLERRPMVPEGAARKFWQNPEAVVSVWNQMAITGPDMFDENRFIKETMRFAMQEADLRPAEFREVFGALPYVKGVSETTVMLREVAKDLSEDVLQGYIKVIEGPATAAGIAKIAYAEPAWITGAGAMGSIEPRVLDVLRSPTWGAFGEELQEDLIRRVEYTNPERLQVHRELTRTLESIAGKRGPGPTDRTWKATAGYTFEEFDKFIERGGGWISPGKGMHDVYVPGAPTLKAMRTFKVGEASVRGQLADTYHEIARTAAAMHQDIGRITPAEYLKELERARPGPMGARGRSLIGTLAYHWAPGGKGMGRVTGGKLIGTRFLRGVSEAGGWAARSFAERGMKADPFVAGLPTRMFQEMFEEMTKSGMYDKEAMNKMRNAFMRGDEIGGMIMRHPIIGEFSAQPMRFQRIEAPGTPEAEWLRRAEIALPEENVRIRAMGIPKEHTLTIGPLVGLAGDKDADIYSAMLLQPNAEKKAAQMTRAADSKFVNRYIQHQVRYQLLKAQAPAAEEALSVTATRIADIRKLGTTQRWVPQLSVQLSAARRALVSEGGAGAANALTLLEWLEQTPISAKHISAAEMEKGGLEAMLGQITSALKTRGDVGERRLKTVVQNIIKDDQVAGGLLTGNITLDDKSVNELSTVLGRRVNKNIEGIDVDSTIKQLMSAMDRFEASGGSRWADLQVARGGKLKISEIGRMVAESSASITRGAKGVFSTVAGSMATASNVAGSLGQGIIKNYKPLALGFAGAMALGAVLSSPAETVGSGAKFKDMKMKMNIGKGQGRMKQESLMPPEHYTGNPTAPNMLGSSRAMVSQAAPSRQTVVRARANSMVNTSHVAGQVAGMSGGMSTNVNIRDNRAGLNPHVIANKLV